MNGKNIKTINPPFVLSPVEGLRELFQRWSLVNRMRISFRRLLRHRRAMVVDHAPAIRPLRENIRGKNGGGNRLSFERTIQVFVKCDPRIVIVDFNRNIGQGESNRRRVLKDTPPALHDRSPSPQDAPARMAALNLRLLGPDLFHLFDVQAFESTIEAFIRFEYLLLFFAHNSNPKR